MDIERLTPAQVGLLADIGRFDARLVRAPERARAQGLTYQILSGQGAILSLLSDATKTGIAPSDVSALIDQGLVRLSRGDRGRLDLTAAGRQYLAVLPGQREIAPKVPRATAVSGGPPFSVGVGLAAALSGAVGIAVVVYVATQQFVAATSLGVAVMSLAVSLGSQLLDRAEVRLEMSLEGEEARPLVFLTPINYGRRQASVVAAGFAGEPSSRPPHFDAFLAEHRYAGAVPIRQEIYPIPVAPGMPADRPLKAYAYAIRLDIIGQPVRFAWCRTATGATTWLRLPSEAEEVIAKAVEWVERQSATGEVIEIPMDGVT